MKPAPLFPIPAIRDTASGKLSSAQGKMKKRYDRRVEDRVFLPGDQVLTLLRIVTSPFQAKFSGPYSVEGFRPELCDCYARLKVFYSALPCQLIKALPCSR